MRTGTLKANSLRIASFEVDYLVPGGTIKAKAAFVNTVSGLTHGWTTHNNWSSETLQKLKELRESMELDLADAHFLDTGEIPQAVGESKPIAPQLVGGLSEHLGSDDADSI